MSLMGHSKLFFTFGLFGFALWNRCFILHHEISLVFSNYPFPYFLQTKIIVHGLYIYIYILFLFYRLTLTFGYDLPTIHLPHIQYFPQLPTLLQIIGSVSGEEPLPERGLFLQHHTHATKVASLLLI